MTVYVELRLTQAVLVGIIANNMGWQWSFYFMAIFMALGFLLILFFVPETAYRRADYLNTDMEMTSRRTETSGSELSNTPPEAYDEKTPAIGHTVRSGPPEKVTWIRTLSPFNGRKTDESFFKLLIRPFPLFLHPAIIWGCLIQGVMIGWTVCYIRNVTLNRSPNYSVGHGWSHYQRDLPRTSALLLRAQNRLSIHCCLRWKHDRSVDLRPSQRLLCQNDGSME